jgi:hypothetical protein
MHRVRQFAAHVTARVEPAERAYARRLLSDSAWRLFDAMPVADRRHALDVVGRLRAGGHDDPDLLTAALLHDAAKGSRMRLWHRVSGVLLEGLAPSVLRRLAHPDSRSWRHPFHLYLHHQDLSADLAEAAGASPRTVSFLRGTARGAGDAQLARALKAADDAS